MLFIQGAVGFACGSGDLDLVGRGMSHYCLVAPSMTFGELLVLGAAIEDADSLDTELVAGAMRRMDLQEFFGHVKFNDDGQMNRNCSAVQYGPHDRTSAVVYPTALAAREIQFPTPTWARRRCQQQN